MPRLPRLPLMLCAPLLAAAVALLAMGRPDSASAHPLGNFTVNHYTRIDVSDNGIELYRVLDMAEIPALQERQRIDANDDGAVDAAESAAYQAAVIDEIASAVTLAVNGDVIELRDVTSELTFPEGSPGLSLLRFTVTYMAELPQGWRDSSPAVEFADEYQAGRLGWREVIVRGGPGIELTGSTAPSIDISDELTAYPEGSLSTPLDVRAASFSFGPGVGAALPLVHPKEDTAVRGNPDGSLQGFTDLLAKDDLSVGMIALALVVAVAFGAYHALTPGHGKTIVAAYLIGSRGTARHALLLGLVVTATHTSSVYAFGFVALYLSQYILPEDLYPWLGIVSGGLILLMGVSLLIARLRAAGAGRAVLVWVRARARRAVVRRPTLALASETGAMAFARGFSGTERLSIAPSNATVDEAHEHAHDGGETHSHGIGPAHSHAIPGQDGRPVTVRSLIGLGMFGGMIPCPSAIVVMLGAIALHRVAFGLVLILAFSVGLAGVLVAIGFALVYAQVITQRVPLLASISTRLEHGGRASMLLRVVPVGSAAAVVGAGLIITLRALAQQGAL